MTELKAGVRGTWCSGSGMEYRCTLKVAEPDKDGYLVVLDEDGYYYPTDNFTPDPESPTEVLVKMSVNDAESLVRYCFPDVAHPLYRVAVSAAKALKEAGL